jgi:hypothetical protein
MPQVKAPLGVQVLAGRDRRGANVWGEWRSMDGRHRQEADIRA